MRVVCRFRPLAATDPRADSSSSKSPPAAAEDVRAKDDETSARTRSPFPIEDFERASFPTAARFLWASRGLTQGTGLKPLDVSQNWLEQDGYTDDGAEGAEGAEGADGKANDGEDAGYHQRRRVIKVVKSPRCPLVGFECDVYAGGIRVDGDKVVKVDPSGADAQGGIRGIYQGAAV